MDKLDRMDAAGGTPEFSLIIPAYNEEKLLPRLLESVRIARERFRGGAGAIEVIVSDNCSTDSTAEIARAAGCRVARIEKRRIGAVRNGGAAIARGRILCFVDADTVIHPESFNAIADVLATGQFVAGATGWKPERNSLGLAATSFIVRTLVTRMMGVDAGVVFCTREAFDAVGGYSDTRDVGEDVQFMRRLIAFGKARGLRVKCGTPAVSTVSMRKFDEHGDWHMFTMALWPLLKRKSFRKIVDEYWYPNER